MNKYTYYVGLNDKYTRKQKISTVKAFETVRDLILNLDIDGCTVTQAKGSYKHDDGYIVNENTLIIELYNINKHSAEKVATSLKDVLNQESVIMRTEAVLSELI